MTDAWALMTAMPPTKGHLHLIQFASSLASHAHVIVCTQPGEPYWQERLLALQKAAQGLPNVIVHHIHKTLPQEPEQDPGFWDMWGDFLRMFGFQDGDYITASETYGVKLAEEVGGVFMPYDLGRVIDRSKATNVRNDPFNWFEDVLPEFQPYLKMRVTIFGAESTGKTTLSKGLAGNLTCNWAPEWARPYLETMGTELNTEVMTRIWKGQAALQRQIMMDMSRPVTVQDTDLFSTIGYWRLHEDEYGPVPQGLIDDAVELKSDFYLMPLSNIPFEEDPLRYGGNVREGSDEFWADIINEFSLPTLVLTSNTRAGRVMVAAHHVLDEYDRKAGLNYTRITKETLGV